MTQFISRYETVTPRRIMHFGTVLFLIVITAGAFLRFSGIGKHGFWTDELFHVFAAESYLEHGTFDVPWSTREYTRALPVTLLTALSFKLFGQSEATARVLFALSNVIFIVIAYNILKDLLSRNVALLFSIFISFSTFSIQMSQECRMYTLFQLFYFLMSIAFLQGLEHDPSTTSAPPAGFLQDLQSGSGVSCKLLITSLGLGLVAAWLQQLTFNFIFVALAYCATMSTYEGMCKGLGKPHAFKYIAVMTLLVVAPLSYLLLADSGLARKLIHLATVQPVWSQLSQSNLDYYQQVLTDSHWILWVLYPLGAFLTIHRYGRTGLFFVLSFCAPFFMHCFIFTNRQSDRYIFYILPFFITVSAVAVDVVVSAIIASASNFTSTLSSGQKSVFYVAVCVSLSLLSYPSVRQTVLDASVARFSNWKGLDPAMVKAVAHGVSITTDRLRFNYYFKQYPNFVIDASDFDRVGGDRVIINLADFRKVLAQHPNLYLVTYAKHFYRKTFVSPAIKDDILREMDRVDSEDDQRIMVFRSRAKTEGSVRLERAVLP